MTATAARPRTRRVLVVDDSAAYRRILSDALAAIEGIEVVGTAANLAIARRKIEDGAIDVVTLDVELGAESGLELLEWMARTDHLYPVILVTGHESARLRSEVDAILLGATSLVRKPAGPAAADLLRSQLARALAIPPRGGGDARAALASSPRPAPAPGRGGVPVLPRPRELVAVGASTGGPPVVLRFLRELPGDFDVPIVVTQHMPAEHVGFFADMLADQSGRVVALARHGAPVRRGEVLVAPGRQHLLVVRSGGALCVALDDGPEEHFCRPAVDPMFRSVAQTVGAAAIGVVMTGMGSDGGAGAVALRAQGAPVVVQDERTSVVWGMPGAVVAHEAADAIVAGDELAAQVQRWTLPGRR